MAFVQAKFALPTVSRADGTLGSYVKASPVTSGPAFRFPADRLALYQAQQKKAKAAANLKGLGETTCSIDPVTGGRVCTSSVTPVATPVAPAPAQSCPACPPPAPCPACAPCTIQAAPLPVQVTKIPPAILRRRVFLQRQPTLRGMGADIPAPSTQPVPFGPSLPPQMVKDSGVDVETAQQQFGTNAAIAVRDYLAKNAPQAAPKPEPESGNALPLAIGGAVVAGLLIASAFGRGKR